MLRPKHSRPSRPSRRAFAAVLMSLVAIAAGAILFACSQTPTSVAVRTFERAQRMDSVCLQLYAFNPASGQVEAIQPRGLPQNECAPVPTDVEPGQNQLFAMVTQSARGEVAVVDLSAGALVDTQRAVPGINFLPMGALPTDVAATPDGVMVFVASAEPNKPAIYGVPTRRILGDTPGFPRDPSQVSLGSWPVCSLPQNPGAMLVVPRKPQAAAPAGDGGTDAGDGGTTDAGAPAADDLPEYELMVVLPGDRRNGAKVITIDPRPFRRGGLPTKADGTPDYDFSIPAPSGGGVLKYDPNLTPGEVMKPGDIQPCKVTSAVQLVGGESAPKTLAPAESWDDGVKWVDGGVDLSCLRPPKGLGCGLEPCCGPRTFPTAPSDAGAPTNEAGTAIDAGALACDDAGTPDAGPKPLDLGQLEPPRLVSMVRDDNFLYVADEGVPFIHMVDVTDPRAPRELAPFVATSTADPTRVVKIKEIAISPPTRDFKRFLYAVDRVDGSILVYDVTEGANASRVPMARPHPELNPFLPIDRIKYNQPVVSLTFARHEVPLAQVAGGRRPNAASGLLCNPNPNLDANPLRDLGYFYRESSADPGISIGPRRLRGVFAFATLASGRVMVIDVDDWDAPCRRPTALGTSDIAPPQPAPANGDDLDPYHSPNPAQLAVTNEAFVFGAPHAPRSDSLIRDDSQTGNRIPRLTATPTVRNAASLSLPTVGPDSVATPIMQTRFSFEVPDVHVDQDWSFTYEGILPPAKAVAAVVSTEAPFDYQSLVLTQGQASFCSAGIEDFDVGRDRATKILRELRAVGRSEPPPGSETRYPPLDKRMGDYVRFTEELLDPADPYWRLDLKSDDPAQCWDARFPPGQPRYDICRTTFGTAGEGSSARDFPIIEAYSDRLVVGRFYTPGITRAREIVGRDPGNAELLRLARCCFHHQVRFDVRAGAEWVANGTSVNGSIGLLHHMSVGTGGRCVPSCDPREALLNSRVPAVSVVPSLAGDGRNSARAMRNPLFSVTIANPANGDFLTRDTVYGFSTRGGFSYLGIATGGGSTPVSPQSMRYIDALGQIAVVDGASQGLVLIDLRAVTVARAPYF